MLASTQKQIETIIPELIRQAGLQDISTAADELPNLESRSHYLTNIEALRKHLRFLEYHFLVSGVNPAGARILDAGSGLGTSALIFSMMAGRPAYGVEKSEHLFAIACKLLTNIPDDIRPRLTPGDVVKMPFEDGFFDIVTCYEALSHFRYPSPSLKEMARVCRPGGTLILSDGNNAANPKIRRVTHQYWDCFETAAPGSYTHDGYHFVRTSYRDLRAAILADRFPELSDRERADLTRFTFGMNQPEIVEAAVRYRTTGAMPERVFDNTMVPVDPIKDDVRENLLDPFDLKHDLEGLGFTVSLNPYFGAARGPLLQRANLLLRRVVSPRLSLRYSKLLIVAAHKHPPSSRP